MAVLVYVPPLWKLCCNFLFYFVFTPFPLCSISSTMTSFFLQDLPSLLAHVPSIYGLFTFDISTTISSLFLPFFFYLAFLSIFFILFILSGMVHGYFFLFIFQSPFSFLFSAISAYFPSALGTYLPTSKEGNATFERYYCTTLRGI